MSECAGPGCDHPSHAELTDTEKARLEQVKAITRVPVDKRHITAVSKILSRDGRMYVGLANGQIVREETARRRGLIR